MFPTYLFSDSGFWIFSVLYAGSVALSTFICVWIMKKLGKQPAVQAAIPRWAAILFLLLIIYQFFHQAEHVSQMYQFKFLGMPSSESHGIVWFADDEWNHFLFNLGYFSLMWLVFAKLLKALRISGVQRTLLNIIVIYSFLIMEGWHVIEHTYRIINHVQGVCEFCSGIADSILGINRLLYHFWMNFLALLMPLLVFFWYGVPGALKKKA